MKDLRSLTKLLKVTQLQYDQQRLLFAKILKEENEVRQELNRLAELKETNQQNDPSLTNMRAIGADLMWQGWLARSRANVNMRLARVLSMKEYEQTKVRRAFGKLTALQRLISVTERQNRKEMTKARLNKTVDMAVVQNRLGIQ